MLSNSYTLNVGSPAADVVFDHQGPIGNNGSRFESDSDQGDLQGKKLLDIRHETTKSGIRRGNVKFTLPQYNSTTEEYEGDVTVSITANRRGTVSLTTVEDALELAEKLLATTGFKADFANAETAG